MPVQQQRDCATSPFIGDVQNGNLCFLRQSVAKENIYNFWINVLNEPKTEYLCPGKDLDTNYGVWRWECYALRMLSSIRIWPAHFYRIHHEFPCVSEAA